MEDELDDLDFEALDIPDVEFEYEPSNEDDECEGGACKL